MPREGEDRSADRAQITAENAARQSVKDAARWARVVDIDRQTQVIRTATEEFEQQQRAFESQIAALGRPRDPSEFGQPTPDLSFTPGDFAGPAFDRTPIQGVGLTTAIEQSSRFGSPTAAFTLSNIQSRFGGEPQSVPRGVPKKTTTRTGGATTTAPEGGAGPIQRVLGDRTRSRLGGQGKF